ANSSLPSTTTIRSCSSPTACSSSHRHRIVSSSTTTARSFPSRRRSTKCWIGVRRWCTKAKACTSGYGSTSHGGTSTRGKSTERRVSGRRPWLTAGGNGSVASIVRFEPRRVGRCRSSRRPMMKALLIFTLAVAALNATPSDATPAVRYAHGRVTVDLQDADLAEVLGEITRQAKLEVRGTPTAERLSIQLEAVPLVDALSRLLQGQSFV